MNNDELYLEYFARTPNASLHDLQIGAERNSAIGRDRFLGR